jgi:hypothetical protein
VGRFTVDGALTMDESLTPDEIAKKVLTETA